jgi:hypothetical protein
VLVGFDGVSIPPADAVTGEIALLNEVGHDRVG